MRKSILTDFGKGIIFGTLGAFIICTVIAVLVHINRKNREIVEYAERQIEIEALREDFINRDSAGFLEDPGVRRAADGAAAEFDRRRDEILQRFRSGNFDR